MEWQQLYKHVNTCTFISIFLVDLLWNTTNGCLIIWIAKETRKGEQAKERKKKLCKQNELKRKEKKIKKERKKFYLLSMFRGLNAKKRNCRFFNIQVIMSVLSPRLRLRGWNIKFQHFDGLTFFGWFQLPTISIPAS